MGQIMIAGVSVSYTWELNPPKYSLVDSDWQFCRIDYKIKMQFITKGKYSKRWTVGWSQQENLEMMPAFAFPPDLAIDSSDSSDSGSHMLVKTYGIKALTFKGITSIAVGYLERLLIPYSMTSLPFWWLISTL